jgi:hypothetical protein
MRLAQREHAAVGRPGQGIGRKEVRDTPHHVQADDENRHDPERKAALRTEALVEKALEQGRQQGLGGRGHDRGRERRGETGPAGSEVGRDARQALQQRRAHGDKRKHYHGAFRGESQLDLLTIPAPR